MNIFADRLKKIRIEKGITQKVIANQLEISTTCYAGYEQGYREPDFTTLVKLCVIFDTTSDYLLGLEDDNGVKTYNNTYNNYGTQNGDVNF